MTYRLIIPRWQPARINQFAGHHWSKMHRLKRVDKNLLCGYVAWARIPVATGPREVSLTITLSPSQRREPDPDGVWKALLDGLVHAKMLIDDSRKWCKQGDVTFERGEQKATTITLRDLGADSD
jgi:hypothetical protein